MIESHLKDVHEDEITEKNCDECPFTAYHMPLLLEHQATHKSKHCKRSSFRRISQKALRNHMGKHQQTTCSQCDFSATSKIGVRKHAKQIHGTSYDYVCDICGKDFYIKNLLTRHMTNHSKRKNTKCNLCTFHAKQNAKRTDSIRDHWKSTHRGVNIDTKCLFCNFEAPEVQDLEMGFRFASGQLEAVETHLREEHKDMAKLRNCNHCQFSAHHATTLKLHQESMHNLRCELCNTEWDSPARLHLHIANAHIRKQSSKNKRQKSTSKNVN